MKTPLQGRLTHLLVAATFIVGVAWLLIPSITIQQHIDVPGVLSSSEPQPSSGPSFDHPIDHLIRFAGYQFDDLLAKEKTNIHDAAQAYRERRGRQPPPGFEIWFEFAQNNSAVLVEDFWDQIYHDTNPFWGVPAKQIREQAHDYMYRISIRDGEVNAHSDHEDRLWVKLWAEMLQTIAILLPDLDMPINEMDESRIIAPWEDINAYMEAGDKTRRIAIEEDLKDTYQSLSSLDESPSRTFDPHFSHNGPYWNLAVVGCPPDSPARDAPVEMNFTTLPPLTGTYPEHSYEGYVSNWTFARSPCVHQHLQGLHGTFVQPVSIANTKKLFPLFGGSKLPMNNEILIPAAIYWTDDPFYSGGNDHGKKWEEKKDEMIWRGVASGGRNQVDNWTRFQRHRFVSMLNATSIRALESDPAHAPPNFVLPVNQAYHLSAQDPTRKGTLSSWVAHWSDIAFVNLLCFPRNPKDRRNCKYTGPWFSVVEKISMREQYDYKYLPDVDGNSYSGRYRGFLGSTSLPIKATIYHEWHNSRLIPWKHFVPMDMTFIDIYGIMEYFLGNEDAGLHGHDEMAKGIATSGKEWSEKVLRKEDMQIYMLRLLLEYARLCDDDREIMGWREGRAPRNGTRER